MKVANKNNALIGIGKNMKSGLVIACLWPKNQTSDCMPSARKAITKNMPEIFVLKNATIIPINKNPMPTYHKIIISVPVARPMTGSFEKASFHACGLNIVDVKALKNLKKPKP